jgi:hypothetical protein
VLAKDTCARRGVAYPFARASASDRICLGLDIQGIVDSLVRQPRSNGNRSRHAVSRGAFETRIDATTVIVLPPPTVLPVGEPIVVDGHVDHSFSRSLASLVIAFAIALAHAGDVIELDEIEIIGPGMNLAIRATVSPSLSITTYRPSYTFLIL